jgi:hypothetical protein
MTRREIIVRSGYACAKPAAQGRKFSFVCYGTTSPPSVPLRPAQGHLGLTLKSCPDTRLFVDTVVMKKSVLGYPTMWEPTFRKGDEKDRTQHSARASLNSC